MLFVPLETGRAGYFVFFTYLLIRFNEARTKCLAILNGHTVSLGHACAWKFDTLTFKSICPNIRYQIFVHIVKSF